MSFSRGRACALCAALLWMGCGSQPASTRPERLAILPFENLTADPGLDWTSRTAAVVLAAQLQGAPRLQATAALTARDAVLGDATLVLHPTLTRHAGRLRLQGSVQDVVTQRVTRTVTAEGATSAGLLPLVGQLAQNWNTTPAPFGTRSEEALRQYGEALQADSPEGVGAAMEKTVAADPSFGAAYARWAQALLARGDREGARQVLARAQPYAGQFTPPDRAQVGLLRASVEESLASREGALEGLARENPRDPEILRRLAEAHMAARHFPEAIEAYRRLLEQEPNNAPVLNTLGYLHAYQGDLDKAKAVLQRTLAAAGPRDANPLDSLGEVHFLRGRFAEAERYFAQAHERDPRFLNGGTLWKAAHARLMTGDRAGAEALQERYLGALRQQRSPLVDLRRAQWLYSTGRSGPALDLLKAAEPKAGADDVGVLQRLQRLLWTLEAGHPEDLRALTAQRFSAAVSPGLRANLEVIAFLLQPDASAAEWGARAEKRYADAAQQPFRELALAYALTQHRHWPEAASLWQKVQERANPIAPGPIEFYRAWCFQEGGRAKEAAALLRAYPVPDANDSGLFGHWVMPRQFRVRAEVAKATGDHAAAAANLALFEKLSRP